MNYFRRSRASATVAGKVVVFGATSVVGQPLSLLLKLCPHVSEVVCCGTALDGDVPPAGVATDLSHVDTSTNVFYGLDANDWPAALKGAQLVMVCSGNCFDPLRTDTEIALKATAPAMEPVMRAIAAGAPEAVIGIVSSPVNALVPLCAEYLKRERKFDPRKLFGVTTLDVIRARKLVAEALAMNPYDVSIPVVGGRGGVTACPLIAQTGLRLLPEDIVRITREVQQYGVPYEQAVQGVPGDAVSTAVAPPVALSLAQAASDFATSVLKAQRGDYGIIECAMIESTMRTETPFFSSRVQLGREGVERILPMGNLTQFENDLIEAAVPEIAKDVETGLAYAGSSAKK